MGKCPSHNAWAKCAARTPVAPTKAEVEERSRVGRAPAGVVAARSLSGSICDGGFVREHINLVFAGWHSPDVHVCMFMCVYFYMIPVYAHVHMYA